MKGGAREAKVPGDQKSQSAALMTMGASKDNLRQQFTSPGETEERMCERRGAGGGPV